MNDAALFDATVPVLRHYLRCAETMLTELPDDVEPLLQERLAPQAFTAAEHVRTAVGFVSRCVRPMLGQAAVDTDDVACHRDALLRFAGETARWLETLTLADFDGASRRVVEHSAGDADLRQGAAEFATLFAMPNFFFHLSMAFAILRAGGAGIGKGDFDGLHRYAADFHFGSGASDHA